MTEHLHDTTTKQALTLVPRSTENYLLFTFSQMLGCPLVLLITAAILRQVTCILKTVATQPKPLKQCYQKLAAFRQHNNMDRT